MINILQCIKKVLKIYPFDFRDFVWLENTNVIVANVGQVVLLVLSAMAQIIHPFPTPLVKVLFLQVSICFYLREELIFTYCLLT